MRHALTGSQRACGAALGVRMAVFARRAFVVAFGYCMAVGTATVVTVAHMLLPSVLPDDGALGSFYAQMRDLPMFLLGGLMITAYAALPGFLTVVALAARYGWHDMPRFLLAGGLNAFPALWLFGSGNPFETGLFFMFCCIGGGLAGGLAYWAAAESWRGAQLDRVSPRRFRAPA